MKFLFKIVIFSLILSSCASYREKDQASKSPKKSRQKVNNIIPRPSYGVMFDLISKEDFDLVFENVTSDHDLEIRLTKDTKLIPAKEGVWELSGVEYKGTFYSLMSTSKKFTFTVTPKKIIYAGTYLLGCPQTNQNTTTDQLKVMKFFNRFELTSNQGSCELVIGDDWKTLRRKLIKKRKYKWLNAIMGF